MNHDYAYCLEYKNGKCQKTKCFRAELVEDLKNYTGDGSMVTWASLKGTKYCEMEWNENRMDDLISRQAAITLPFTSKEDRKYQTYNLDDAYELGWLDYQKCIEDLPSAERRGRWILREYMSEIDSFIYTEYECSNCGEISKKKSNHCPNCGAKMEEKENEND